MECNKDEAGRAKSIAERKLEQKDYCGAKKFALKGQSLYPGLEGISQLLTTLDVYVSAENKISGEIDWYGVLNVNPSADDHTIKRQYRKLALLLHPDKNCSIGADGSFKLISEAWSLLSDKAKRSAYNQRRGNKVFQQNAQRHTGGPSAPPNPSQQKVPTHTGGPSAPSRPSQKKVPTNTGGPSAPSRPSQKKVSTHTGGPSAPSQQKIPTHTGCPSTPSKSNQQKVPTHAGDPSTRSRQQKVPIRTGGPTAPSRPRPHQPNVPTHTGSSSTPSTPGQHSNCASRKTSAPKSQKSSAKAPKKPTHASPHQRIDTFWTMCCSCNTQFKYPKIYRNCTLLCHSCQKSFLASETIPPVNHSKSANMCQQRSSVNNLAGRNAYVPGRNVPVGKKSGVDTSSTRPFNVDELKRSHTESNASAGWEGCFKEKKLGEPEVRKQRRTCNV